ncbi:MAG: SpoIID/LytB domain-containing protein, partial [Oscillospiraceae bacterium]|nr:SpoIID/LytB domain-containing protein [Oscillospiraceae bacterium]
MNLKKILSGTAALLAVGMFYAFTFCIVQETDSNAVPTELYSNDSVTAQGDAAEKAGENTAYENVGAKGTPVLDSAVTGGIMPVSDMPEISNGSVPVSVSISGDEITDAYYIENSDLDLEGFSEEELEGLPEDDDVNDYEDVSLNSKNYASDSKAEEEGARTTKSKKNKKKKPSYPDDEMLIIEYTDEGSNSSAPKGAVMQKDESGWDGSLNVAEQAGSGKVNTSDYVNEDENYPSGEYFTARVHGEVSNYDAYELVCMIVANEMSPSFAPEALKAQAVAAYSYLKYHSYKGLTPSVLTRTPIPA